MNTILAPVLIAGWGTGHPMGVAGAGLASTIAIVFGVVSDRVYFVRLEKYVPSTRRNGSRASSSGSACSTIGLPRAASSR